MLRSLGFGYVTISNLDEGQKAGIEPYMWRREDAENLSLADEGVDVAIVHAGLHHCRSPHRALLELYRVARVAAIAVESRDSVLMRLGVRMHAAADYELAAVAGQGLEAGGVANSSTPNFVYRWTEREIEKTLASYAPHVRHRVRYFHELELDYVRWGEHSTVRRLARPLGAAIARVLPSQANLFAFVIEKPCLPEDLQPWMRLDEGEIRPDPDAVGTRRPRDT